MPTNFPPVGDIKVSKAKGTFNTYKLELSYGQIVTIQKALEALHDDAIADELLAMFNYYTQELPGPGEDEEEAEARKAAVTGAEGGEGDEDFPVPMPPGQETAAPEGQPPVPEPEEPGMEEEAPETASAEEVAGGRSDLDRLMNATPEEEADERVPAPPAPRA